MENAVISADSGNIEATRTDDYDEYYIAAKGRTTALITAEWEKPVTVGCIVLKENILCSQRVESFTIEVELDGSFSEVYRGTVIGYKCIVPLNNTVTKRIRINITDSRTEPTLAFVGVYKGKEN